MTFKLYLWLVVLATVIGIAGAITVSLETMFVGIVLAIFAVVVQIIEGPNWKKDKK